MTGIGLAVLAWALFATHDAAIKYLVQGGTPPWQVLLVRSTCICAVAAAMGGPRMLRRAAQPRLWPMLILRGVIVLGAWLCFYTAAGKLPLAQLLTLYFAAPVLTTFLAVPLLGERITPGRGAALGLGFAGVVVACDPVGLSFSWPTGLALMAAGFWGYTVVLLRQTALAESTWLIMFFTNGVFWVATALAVAVLGWHPMSREQLMLLGWVGAVGTCAQLCMFEAMRRTAATVLATTEYTSLVWAFVLGFVVFGDVPAFATFAGAGLIVAAGAVLVTSEHRRRGRAA